MQSGQRLQCGGHGFVEWGLGGEDIGFDEESDFDAGGYTPAFFAFETEGGEGLAEGFAEAQAVKKIEGGALGMLGVNGGGKGRWLPFAGGGWAGRGGRRQARAGGRESPGLRRA